MDPAVKINRPVEKIGKRYPIGLDLGSTAIKWVQLAKVNGHLTIVQLGMEPRKSSPSESDIDRRASLKEQLRELAAKNRFHGPAVLSLPVEDVTLRLLKMPHLPENEMSQAIRWQVEQTLPAQVGYEEFSIDYITLEQLTNPPEPRILLASTPRQRVLMLAEQLRSIKLQPLAVEIDPLALERCLRRQGKLPAHETVLLLHLGALHASFSIVVKGQLMFSRSILTTGQNLTNAIANQLRVTPDEAEQLKCTYGLSGVQGSDAPAAPAESQRTATAVAQALASPMENLMVDMLHAFKGFSHQATQSQIQRFDRVFVDGGTSQLPYLLPWLQARLGVPVESVNSLRSVQSSDSLEPYWSIAMGLALRELPDTAP